MAPSLMQFEGLRIHNRICPAPSLHESPTLRSLQMFDLEPSSCLRVSAKTGMGLDSVLPAIVEAVPPPSGDEEGELRMLLFDAVHDEYRHEWPTCMLEQQAI